MSYTKITKYLGSAILMFFTQDYNDVLDSCGKKLKNVRNGKI